jgi:hypothetical protein
MRTFAPRDFPDKSASVGAEGREDSLAQALILTKDATQTHSFSLPLDVNTMMRLVQLVLFLAWLVGAVTGGLTVAPERPSVTASGRVVATTDWAKLTVQAGQVVLTVGQGERRWRAASPLPSVLRAWFPDTGKSAPESRRMPLGGTPVTPL